MCWETTRLSMDTLAFLNSACWGRGFLRSFSRRYPHQRWLYILRLKLTCTLPRAFFGANSQPFWRVNPLSDGLFIYVNGSKTALSLSVIMVGRAKVPSNQAAHHIAITVQSIGLFTTYAAAAIAIRKPFQRLVPPSQRTSCSSADGTLFPLLRAIIMVLSSRAIVTTLS